MQLPGGEGRHAPEPRVLVSTSPGRPRRCSACPGLRGASAGLPKSYMIIEDMISSPSRLSVTCRQMPRPRTGSARSGPARTVEDPPATGRSSRAATCSGRDSLPAFLPLPPVQSSRIPAPFSVLGDPVPAGHLSGGGAPSAPDGTGARHYNSQKAPARMTPRGRRCASSAQASRVTWARRGSREQTPGRRASPAGPSAADHG